MSLEGRRLVLEHAMLEDLGEDRGVCAFTDKGYTPVSGAKDDEQGALARRVVLGKAGLPGAGGK
jgi:hypothetical protein